MTHSVLLMIDKPTNASPAIQNAWGRIQLKCAEQLNLYANMKKINESSLEIPLDNSLPAMVNILSIVQAEQFSYRVLFFEKEPPWIQCDFPVP